MTTDDHRMGVHFRGQIRKRMEKLLDRTPAIGYEICDFDDDMGQSVLV